MSGLGHIGELQVIDYLEKNEKCSIFLPMKDKGIDFIAVRNNRSIQVQVKTSKFLKNRYFWFDLSIKKIICSENTIYIFVLYVLPGGPMLGKTKNYLVIPSLILKQWIKARSLATKSGNDDIVNFFVYPSEKEKVWIYKNKTKEIDLTRYWNNFGPLHAVLF